MRSIMLKPLSQAVIAATLISSAHAATINDIDEGNLLESLATSQAFVYPEALPAPDTAPPSASNGWLEITTDSGVTNFPGIEVYNEVNGDFVGCIMAKNDFLPADPGDLAPNCLAPNDSGKRFKLKATTVNAPIDLVIKVTADNTDTNAYRVIGKFSNLTGGRLGGARYQLGFGIGDDFVPSADFDGLSISTLTSQPVARYPGGLFGGSPAEGLPFFSTEPALFELNDTASGEDILQTAAMPLPYKAIFGNWLALDQVPNAWFFDDDGNPDTDAILLAYQEPDASWWTYDKEFTDPTFDPEDPAFAYNENADFELIVDNMTLVRRAVEQAELDAWAADPSRVLANVDTDGTTPLATPVDFAIWNPETELYDVDAAYQQLVADFYVEGAPRATLTADEMKDDWIVGGGGNYVREPGYVQGPVEDLANTNINFSITAANTASWTTCTSNGVDPAECTFTLRLTALDETFLPPIPRKSSSSGGCTVGSGNGPFDPMLPGLLALALGGLLLRRRRRA